jgi:putative hemolysin
MRAAFACVALALAPVLVLSTFTQLLYLESVRLRTRECPALEFFKLHLQSRLGLEVERGTLSFSIIKHTTCVLLGFLFAFASAGTQLSARGILEPLLAACLSMVLAAYMVPHLLYRRTTGHWLLPFVPMLRAMAFVVRPVVFGFEFFQSLVDLSETSPDREEPPTSEENVEALITAGTEEGLIEESDRELIQSVVAFGDKTVREVMTPRPNMVAIGADRSMEDLRDLVINEQYSRIPVFEGSIDRVIGFVHVRDMFELDEEERKTRTVRELVRPIRFVPETKPVNDLVREMQQDRAHMAIVVDEYGNTAGLVTLEDLVEEVFGEIQDEHEPELDIAKDSAGAYIVSGNFGLDRLEELVEFRPEDGTESTTVGGLIMEWLGHVPRPGETVEQQGVRIEVLASNDRRVEQVRISRAQNTQHA